MKLYFLCNRVSTGVWLILQTKGDIGRLTIQRELQQYQELWPDAVLWIQEVELTEKNAILQKENELS